MSTNSPIKSQPPTIPGFAADHPATKRGLTHAQLLRDFLHSELSLPDLAARHALSILDLAAWHDSHVTQSDLATCRRLAHSQARNKLSIARPQAITLLGNEVTQHERDDLSSQLEIGRAHV